MLEVIHASEETEWLLFDGYDSIKFNGFHIQTCDKIQKNLKIKRTMNSVVPSTKQLSN